MTTIDLFKINRSTQVMDRCATAGSLQDLHVSLSGPVSLALGPTFHLPGRFGSAKINLHVHSIVNDR